MTRSGIEADGLEAQENEDEEEDRDREADGEEVGEDEVDQSRAFAGFSGGVFGFGGGGGEE